MKVFRLLMMALVALLVGCIADNDETNTGGGGVEMTRMTVRLTNGARPVTTRAKEGKGDITDGTNQIGNAHVFILDATGTDVIDYASVLLSGDVAAITSSGWPFPDPIPVDARVFVLGNVHRDYNRTVRELETLTEIKAFTSDIWDQKEYETASMATIGPPVALTITPSGTAQVSVSLKPVISRLELHSIEAAGDIQRFTVTGVFLTDYYTTFTYGGSYAPGAIPIDNTQYLEANDGMTGDEMNLPAQGSPLTAAMSGNRIWAYNVVAGSLPRLIVRMKNVVVGSATHPGPLYLTVMNYGGTTAFEAGKIYRIPKITFFKEHLALSPAEEGVSAEPIEWDEDELTPGISLPGASLDIEPATPGFTSFAGLNAPPQAETFNVTAGSLPVDYSSLTLSIANPDGNFTVNDTNLTVNGNFTISPVGHNLSGSNYSAVVTVTGQIAGSSTALTSTCTVIQSFSPLPPLAPIDTSSQGNIIYFVGEDDETYLSLGTWSDNAADDDTPGKITKATYQSKMAVFKFGGIVGMDLVDRPTTVFSSDISAPNNAIRFNPINAPIDAYTDGTTGSASVTEANMSPPKVPGTLNATPVSYTGDNIAEVYTAWKEGKGDPCQLLGIPASKLKTALAANDSGVQLKALLDSSDRPADYTGWVTPTQAQNNRFVNGQTDQASDSYGANAAWNPSLGVGTPESPYTVKFNHSIHALGGKGAVLPAAGRRDVDSGAVNYQATIGYYWSSTMQSATNGSTLYYASSSIVPANTYNYTYGFAVRCVRPGEPEPELAPIDTSSQGNIIYFVGDGDDTYLSLGTWSDNAAYDDTPGKITKATYQSKMAVFKFGGIVGMDLVDRGTATVFSSDISTPDNAIQFNPLPASYTISSYAHDPDNSYHNENSMKSPSVPGTFWDTPVSYNGENIADVFDAWKEGMGDPCQLLGIPASKLKTALAANDSGALQALLDSSDRSADYTGWVTPTQAQNSYFIDGTTQTAHELYDAGNVVWNANGYSSSDPASVTFINSSHPLGGHDAVLPAAGYRYYDNTGKVTFSGRQGRYQSSTCTDAGLLYFLGLDQDQVKRISHTAWTYGNAVRCIRP